MKICFYDAVDDAYLKFAVIIARHNGKWVFCRHRDRDSYELPGGHREPGESILAAAKRELYEETGALQYAIVPVCTYSVKGRNSVNPDGGTAFGMLYHAEIESFDPELHSEIERIEFFDDLPERWTYPQIQPALIREYERRKLL